MKIFLVQKVVVLARLTTDRLDLVWIYEPNKNYCSRWGRTVNKIMYVRLLIFIAIYLFKLFSYRVHQMFVKIMCITVT